MNLEFFVTASGFLVNDDGKSYVLERVGDMLKVTGPDVCYFLLESARGLEQMSCTTHTLSLLIGN
jgi:hypothetical protein